MLNTANAMKTSSSISGFKPRCMLRRSPCSIVCASSTATKSNVVIKDFGAYTVKGTSRRVNEDRWDVKLLEPSVGKPLAFAGVYDGHGGTACAEWLSNKLYPMIEQNWSPTASPSETITNAYVAADAKILSPTSGFLGLGERGVGGSKCGSTAATILIYKDPKDQAVKLLTANIGDARILLVREGKPVQLSEDHVPDKESERLRIERTNPNRKMPLVRFVEGTWRVGGLLALSRAFGDAYLKGSLQFEGVAAGSDGYSSGFGLIAEPFTTVTTLEKTDTWVVVSSDGTFYEMERGGGGGLDNESVTELLNAAEGVDCSIVAKTIADSAQAAGSTDDVTIIVMRLGL